MKEGDVESWGDRPPAAIFLWLFLAASVGLLVLIGVLGVGAAGLIGLKRRITEFFYS